jgi:hypothetical protein
MLYPVRVEARLDDGLSRWLWLFKWFLAIPHYFLLAFLWIAFALMSVVAFFAILFTGKYPRGIFDFNVGVLRWSWRVAYYSYGALATDRYPPFSLQEDPDYPVHLEVEYPEHLSRGLVLVKWWLLAIPHYLVVGLLVGGAWMTFRTANDYWGAGGPGLIGILVLIAVVTLTFTGTYPRALFDLILGFNRWVIRVAAYAALMTDAYPPFRLDAGGSEPDSTVSVRKDSPPTGGGGTPATEGTAARGWSGGSIFVLIAGILVALMSLGLLIGGGATLWADRTQREGGFVTSPTFDFSSDSFAIVSDDMKIHMDGPDWVLPRSIIGDARIRVSGADEEVFVGIARTSDLARYLDGVAYSTVTDLTRYDGRALPVTPGGAPAARPEGNDFWIASSTGEGSATLRWPVTSGSWSMVVMNADASRGLSFFGDFGAEAPVLGAIAVGLLIAGGFFLLIAVALIGGAVSRAGRPVSKE